MKLIKLYFIIIGFVLTNSCSTKTVEPMVSRKLNLPVTLKYPAFSFQKTLLGLEKQHYHNLADRESYEEEPSDRPLSTINPDWSKPFYRANSIPNSRYLGLLHTLEDVNHSKFDNDWRALHQTIQKNYTELSQKYWLPYIEQYEAYMMLETYLFKQPVTSEVQEAMAIYLEWLLKNNAVHTEVIYQGVQKMQGYWTPKQIQEAEARILTIQELKAKTKIWHQQKYNREGMTQKEIMEDILKRVSPKKAEH